MRHTFVTALTLISLSLGALSTRAEATPIVYKGVLTPGQASSGTSTQDNAVPSTYGDDPAGADFWSLVLPAGARVIITGRRAALSPHFDMALWVFFNPAGLYTNTSAFFNGVNEFLSASTPGFIAQFDDEITYANPLFAFGDPSGLFIAPSAGTYTFIVTSNLSDIGSPDNYTLQADLIPEPASILLMGTGLLLLARSVRRGQRRSPQ
jgi:hypothetical protein